MNKKQKWVLARIIAAAVMLIVLHFVPVEGWLRLVLYMIPYLVIGYDILRKAVKGILNLRPFDENFLMAVATVGAVALGDYAEGVAVMLFYQIGELFQSVAVGKSRRNIRALLDLRPDGANLVGDDEEVTRVSPEEVAPGRARASRAPPMRERKSRADASTSTRQYICAPHVRSANLPFPRFWS